MEQVKSLIKDHLEKNKFFDSLKSAVSKDPKLGNIDRNVIIEKLKSEGVLSDILNQIPIKKPSNTQINQSDSFGKQSFDQRPGVTTTNKTKRSINTEHLDPHKRYLSCRVV